jgi:hypothetical protein
LEEAAPSNVVEAEVHVIAELLTYGRIAAFFENIRTHTSLTEGEFVAYSWRVVVATLDWRGRIKVDTEGSR